LSVTVGSTNNTGINPWWTYEQGTIPGVGKYMINVANGNLIVQSDDVDVPERGIDLAFRRTYNSMSGRDQNADDGAPTPGQYGDGWTNNFDTHLAVNSSGGISVFDIDGARYDYTPSDTGCLTAPAGMHNTLCWDGGCGYFWTKKSGTVYYYFEPSFGPGCEAWATQSPAYSGRLYMIFARNNNNWIRLTYSWAGGDASQSSNLTQISVAHEDGQSLVLNFAAATSGATLLSSVVRPDNVTITYAYDGSNDLTAVTEPSSGSSNGAVNNTMHAYGWYAGHQMSGAAGPRWTTGSWGGDGGYVSFGYTSNQVTYVWHYGIMNFTPADGTSTQLQSGPPTGGYTFAADTYIYGSGSTTFGDWDGHGNIWYFDSANRVTQTREWTGALWLLGYASWDADNNLTESVDVRGNATDYAYDSNGNTVAVALPTVSTNQGTFRPTSLYSYDRTNNANNIVQYCDPVKTHSIGGDWTSNPGTSDSLCPNQSGSTRYVWDYSDPTYEPFGRLSNSYTPLGYHHSYSYSTAAQGGDFGLPSNVNGDSITQSDGTVRSPQQSFAYDEYGNRTSYSTGVGSTTLSFDSLNRPTAVTDPDLVTSRTCYYPNGQVQAKQSAAQYALDGNVVCGSHSVNFTYNPDGNEASEIHHYGNQAGTTTKYYDGADQLVEVAQPHDSSDLYAYAWLTRYFYDLAQGNTVSVDGATFHAYGNLYKTQEYLPNNPVIVPNTTPGSPAWTDVRGNAFDALDRATAAYENAFGSTPKITNTYDTNSNYGLLSQTQNAVGQQSITSYLSTGWTYQQQYQNDGGVTPSETYTYDADGRANSIQSSQFGSENLAYDTDGRLMSDSEPTGGGYNSPATMTYGYYADGLRQALSVSSSVVNAANAFQYSYRTDGLLKTQHLTYPITGDFAWTHTNAGRELTQSDPYTGVAISGAVGTRTLQAKTFTYDPYGRVASLILPQGYTYGTFTYDAEDETTGYTRSNAYCPLHCSNQTRAQTYNIRAELTAVNDTTTSINYQQSSADGTLITPNGNGGSADGFDARSGMIESKYLSRYQFNIPYAYDSAGRQGVVTDTYPNGATNGTATRSYDAENHIVAQAYAGSNSFECPPDGSLDMCGPQANGGIISPGVTNTYAWGPKGHPINIILSGASASIHWDGDDVLFESGSNGLVDLQAGKLAAGVSFNFTISDRDMAGQQVSSHTATAFGAWDAGAPSHQCGACSKGEGNKTIPGSVDSTWVSNDDPSSYAPATTFMSGVREDGYNDSYGNTFQGVRAYDGNLGQWTSPDAYGGDVRDPGSQKPYMWNRNNPLTYSDPSGFKASVDGNVGDSAASGMVQNMIDDIIARGNKADKNSDIYRLAQLLADPNVNVQIHLVNDSGLTDQGGANTATLNIDSGLAQNDSAGHKGCTCDVTIHWQAVKSSGNPAESLEQGIANDVGMSYAWRGMMGDGARVGLYKADVKDIKFRHDNPADKHYDRNEDKWANDNILGPLHLPPDL
jgi:RHS repeat-associated protein